MLVDVELEVLVVILFLLGVYSSIILSGLLICFIEKIESNIGNYMWNFDILGGRSV